MPTLTPDDARERFAAARVARLATVSGEGVPHLVPVVFAVVGSRVLVAIDGKPKRTRALRRLAGPTGSVVPIRIPPDTRPGVYRLRAVLIGDGLRDRAAVTLRITR